MIWGPIESAANPKATSPIWLVLETGLERDASVAVAVATPYAVEY